MKLCELCEHPLKSHGPYGCMVKLPHGQYTYCECLRSNGKLPRVFELKVTKK